MGEYIYVLNLFIDLYLLKLNICIKRKMYKSDRK